MVHYAQVMQSKKFQQFDWGKKKNKEKYGQSNPPEIDLTAINAVPTALFVGTEDDLGDTEDNHWLHSQLNSVVHYQEVKAGHATFLVGKDMSYFGDVMGLLQKYNPVHAEKLVLLLV